MENIKNIEVYTERMQKGMSDKLFFLSEIDNDNQFIFVDFGCADGTLLKILLKYYDNMIAVGIDNNEDMLNLAKENCKEFKNRIYFFQSMDKFYIDKQFKKLNIKKYLNFSSVFHEIYNYCNEAQIQMILFYSFSGYFDKIFIRDMEFHNKLGDNETPIEDLEKILSLYKHQVHDFAQYFGSIANYKEFIHFLMKHDYVENWDRECQENYFPFYTFTIIAKIFYKMEKEEYLLPYFETTWKERYDLNIKATTHANYIFTRKYNTKDINGKNLK